jgi:hypothetical protein
LPPFVEEAFFSLPYVFGAFVKNQVDVAVWGIAVLEPPLSLLFPHWNLVKRKLIYEVVYVMQIVPFIEPQ